MNLSNSWIKQFNDLYRDRINVVTEWKQKGGRALGYIYSHVPEELIHAAGILPVQLLEDVGSVIKANRHLPQFYCYQGKGNLELALRGKYDFLDGVVMAHSCDPLRKVFGIWEHNFPDKFNYFLPLPLKGNKEAREYYREELLLFKAALEELTGSEIKEEAIRKSIGIYNKNRELVKKVYELRKALNPVVSGSDVVEILRCGVVVPREMHNNMLENFLQGISSQSPDKKQSGEKRIFVSTISLNDKPLMVIIEDLGGQVVLDDLAMGARYYWEPVEGEDTLGALSSRYVAAVPFPGRYPGEGRAKILVDFCKSYGVEGAIIKSERYCDPYLYEQPYIMEMFKEQELPVMALDFEDLRAEEGRVRTRIQAFLETLEK